jgi:hypothetical protein
MSDETYLAPEMPGLYEIETASGRYLDLSAPDPSAITLGDVAQGLSHACRFAGQSSRFYSVAEHAWLVAERLRERGEDERVQLAGLHHDDAEAYVGDATRPMKALIPEVAKIEATVFAAVCSVLGLSDLPFDDPAIKEADDWALAVEAYYLLPSKGRGWVTDGILGPSRPPHGVAALFPRSARRLWLEQHEALSVSLAREKA